MNTSNSDTSQTNKHMISVVVPVYNEAGTLAQFHEELTEALRSTKQPFEILYIDDRSSDGTFEMLTRIAKTAQKKSGFNDHFRVPYRGTGVRNGIVKVFHKEGKQGKAFSLMEGFERASGDILVMIDGDLQYPPAAIANMVRKLDHADIIVAKRRKYKDSFLRRTFSRTFRYIFGKMLFDLETDIQSGLKVFTRQVYETNKFRPVSPWTFDLEFLHRAVQTGFIIDNYDITFSPRTAGTSKMNVLSQTWEIGWNAFMVKMKKIPPLLIPGTDSQSMKGAGIGYKKQKYITHTRLPFSLLALQTFSRSQKLLIAFSILLVLTGLILSPLLTIRILIATLSILYFVDGIFNFSLILRSLRKSGEITVSEEDLAKLSDYELPSYSILCPLYKEVHVVSQFVQSIEKLDWPKEKLDVLLLLEEDDTETIDAVKKMQLPQYVRTIIVPDSLPKTKPKACNYGLAFAKGEYLVIYDAEDMPEPLQLKKAYLAFRNVPENVQCLQAKLNYYNARQNFLTRFFSAEYSLWFDLTLPGLQSFRSTIPLGGTSNHFRTKKLREFLGWDPFNVTEDADLGVRLFKQGYRTEIIDSITLEEATSKLKNWLRQRSRWLKGYMQTYLVHTRNFSSFVKEKGPKHAFIFQLTVGGKILFILLNPLMWLMTFSYFAFYNTTSPVIEAIYVPPISYLAVTSWIFGNFMFYYLYMIACGRRKDWDIIRYTIFIPVYWLMMSTAGAIAFYQLLFKPHYWEKTLHGFHLPVTRVPEVPGVPRVSGEPVPVPVPEPMPAPAPVPVFYPGFAPKPAAGFAETLLPFKKTEDFAYAFSGNQPLQASKGGRASTEFPKNSESSWIQRANWVTIVGIPAVLLFTIDVFFAAHYFSSSDFHTYFILSVIGKSAFFLSQIAAFTAVSLFFKNKNTNIQFYYSIFFTFLLSWLIFIVFGMEGSSIIPLIPGFDIQAVIPYTQFYLFSFMCFAVAGVFIPYHIKQKNYSFIVISFFVIIAQSVFLLFKHESILDFSKTLAYFGAVDLVAMVLLQLHIETSPALRSRFRKAGFTKNKTANSLRILIFNWRDTRHVYAGGAEVYIRKLAKRWVKEGNKVTLFCGNDHLSPKNETVDGIEIIRRGGTYLVYVYAFFYYFLKLRGRYDVIIDCENGIPFFTPLYVREPVMLLIHHVHQEVFRICLKTPLKQIAALLEGRLMPLVYRKNTVVTVSPSSQREISNIGIAKAKNIAIVYNGLSPESYCASEKTPYPSFIFFGRLKKYKNIDIAIKAFSEVVKINKNARLTIAGTGEEMENLQKLAHSLNISHKVKFIGKVNESDKAALLARHWVMLQPSSLEGWGLTVMEANAAGTPVIASRAPGLQDSVIDGYTGVLVEPGNISALAENMRNLMLDEILRRELSNNAVIWSRNFSWDKSSSEFFSLIDNTVRERSRQLALGDYTVAGAE